MWPTPFDSCPCDATNPWDHASICEHWAPSQEWQAWSERIKARGVLVEAQLKPVGYFEWPHPERYEQGADSERYER